MGKRHGFTLIELLVVIAVIAILAAVLFPVFAQARDKARSVACLSNMRQIGTAIMMYVQDYDETFPAAYNYNGGYGWQEEVEPYVKAGQRIGMNQTDRLSKGRSIFVCPSYGAGARPNDPQALGAPTDPCPVATLGTQPNRSYACSEFIFGIEGLGSPSATLAAIETPAQTVAIVETEGSRDWVDRDDRPAYHECGYMMGRMRHQGGGNYILADGHAKWYKGPADWWRRSPGPAVYRHCCDEARAKDDAVWLRPISGCGCDAGQP
jgi:prepilin-type N-terminal cleavage/methylation domain-containing protein/prepilin-type processing-associated H-X9-DG protein